MRGPQFLSLLRRGLRAARALKTASPAAAPAAAKTASNLLASYRLYRDAGGLGGGEAARLARASSVVAVLEKLVALPPPVLSLVLRKGAS